MVAVVDADAIYPPIGNTHEQATCDEGLLMSQRICQRGMKYRSSDAGNQFHHKSRLESQSLPICFRWHFAQGSSRGRHFEDCSDRSDFQPGACHDDKAFIHRILPLARVARPDRLVL